MPIFLPFLKNKENPLKPLFDNSNRIARILYRLGSYKRIFIGSVKKGVPVADLVRSQFPYLLKDAEHPPILALEFTNYCNLKCLYCTSPLGQRERGYMSDEVFAGILASLKEMKTNRIQLVGNGESTIHPKFSEFISELGKTKRFISMVTNGQWIKEQVISDMLRAPLDLVEISIDSGGKEGYERSRVNGNFEKLLSNLTLLKKLRDELRSKTMINIRVMLRPSQKDNFNEESLFWKQYADTVMPQYIVKINNTTYEDDVFMFPQRQNNSFPKCSMPFKHLEVKWTGEILMCYNTLHQMGPPGLVIGNVKNETVLRLWNGEIMKQYREAHRKRLEENMPVCKGCVGT
jgi:MoaA/NifB/PqqE/SkfB family radical SAM enzyme